MDTSTTLLPGTLTAWNIRFTIPAATADGSLVPLVRAVSDDRDEAERIRADLEQLLQASEQWDVARYHEALTLYHRQAVDLFYAAASALAVPAADPADVREALLPFPDRLQDYRRLLLVGITGAGKTSLLRHCLGLTRADFPATDSSRTTTFAIESICDPQAAPQAIVTLLPMARVRMMVLECVEHAIEVAVQDESDKTITTALNSSRDQRFHLPQIVGEMVEVALTAAVAPATLLVIVKDIACEAKAALGIDSTNALGVDDQGRLMQWLEYQSERCAALVDALLVVIRARLAETNEGEWQHDALDWPIAVRFQAKTIPALEEHLWRFAEVKRPSWGQIFTPLVTGIRMRAPFRPHWWPTSEGPRVILLDGEGVGHEKDVKDFLPSRLAKQLADVDAIVAVEKATNPMNNAAAAMFRTIAVEGMVERVFLTYTHCDELEAASGVEGDHHKLDEAQFALIGRLANPEEGDTVAAVLRNDARRLRQHLEDHTYYLGHLNTQPLPERDAEDLQRLFLAFARLAPRETSTGGMPVPFPLPDRLERMMHDAGQAFWRRWLSCKIQ